MEGKRDFFSNIFSGKLEYLYIVTGLDYIVILVGFPFVNDACALSILAGFPLFLKGEPSIQK